MIKTFTLKELSETSRQEAETRAKLLGAEVLENDTNELKKSSLDNILAYSKSLGTTDTRLLGKQILTLN